MVRDTLNSRQFIMMLVMFLLGSSLVMDGNLLVNQDTFICILISLIAALPLVSVYARISALYHGKNLYEISDILFGKYAGRLVSLIIIGYCLYLASFTACNFTVFTQSTTFDETPSWLIAFALILLCSYLAICGIQTMGRVSVLVFAVTAVLCITVTLLSCRYFELNNILPLLRQPKDKILQSSVSFFSYPLTESVIFLIFAGRLKTGQSKHKVFVYGLIIAGVTLSLVSVRNVLILGQNAYSTMNFPSYTAISRITVGNYFQHMESLVSASLLCGVFIKSSVCLYGAFIGLKHVFHFKKSVWIFLFSLTTTGIFLFFFKTTKDVFTFSKNVYYIYALPIQVGLPAVIWIFAECKKQKQAQ